MVAIINDKSKGVVVCNRNTKRNVGDHEEIHWG